MDYIYKFIVVLNVNFLYATLRMWVVAVTNKC